MSRHLNLFLPEWQGYGVDNSPQKGAVALRESLFSQIVFQEIEIASDEVLQRQNEIVGYDSVLKTMREIRHAIQQAQATSIFTLGGTCGVEVVPVTWLNEIYQGDLGVVWLDAHGDLNTPESSPSGHFHGMPVRTILGEGDASLCDLAFSVLKPEQIFQVGVRDLDEAESVFIESSGIRVYDVEVDPAVLLKDISSSYSNVYIHFDLDVLDPEEFAEMIFHVSSGMSWSKALAVVKELTQQLNLVGGSLLEFVPRDGLSEVQTDLLKNLANLLMAE